MKSKPERNYNLKAGQLSVTLKRKVGGISLFSIRDTKTSLKLLSEERPLFSLKATLLDTTDSVTLDSLTGWNYSEIIKTDENGFSIILSDNAKIPKVTVSIRAALTENRITWATHLSNENPNISLTECDYPVLSFDVNENIDFFYPYGCGEYQPCAKEGGYNSEQNYPSYGASMQYLAFWDRKKRRGIYCGAHDPAPAYKKIHYSRKADENVFTLKITLPLTNIDRGANSQELCGKCVWELFDGDWYDAAIIYRNWAFSEASWTTCLKETPEWLKKNNHWWLIHDKEGFKAEDVVALNRDLGVDSATHIYFWHQNPFDNDYPHYFPIKENFLEEIKKLKEAGIRVMPYINGRLWDTKDKGSNDWQFSELAKPYATKEKPDKLFIETYNSKEEDGSKVELAIMCPSSALWQEKMKEITSRLFNEVGVDAVYMDQIAAAKPNLCVDKTHNHPAGGGTWWCQSYANLLDHVTRSMPEGCAITTECTADPFMRYMGAYLSWLWVKNNQVPAFPAIYSDYMPVFGLAYTTIKNNDGVCWRVFSTQSLLFGEQMGWIEPRTYNEMPFKDFYKKLVNYRAKLCDYFNGRMLRPPFVTDDAPRMYSKNAGEAYDGIIDYPAVQAALWQNKTTRKKLLILVNTSETKAKAKINAEIDDTILDIQGDVSKKIKIKSGKMSLTLPPLSVMYAEV